MAVNHAEMLISDKFAVLSYFFPELYRKKMFLTLSSFEKNVLYVQYVAQ